MSRSPRRLLRRAADALAELGALQVKHPELYTELDTALGAEQRQRLDRAVEVIAAAAAALDAPPDRATDRGE